MKSALIFNNIASFGSIAWRIVGQLLAPPLLLSFWGTDVYGEWLLITSIPMFLSVADLGFTDASAADMSMEIARGNKDRVQKIFQSTLLLTIITMSICCFLASGVLFLEELRIGEIHFNRIDIVVAYMFVVYSALLVISRFFLGTLKAGGFYARSTMIYDGIQFLELVFLVIAVSSHASLILCATGYVAIRLVNIGALLVLQKREMPWLKLGVDQAERSEVARLFAPAMAAMAIPLAMALNFQGMVWIAGSALGPTAAAVVGTVRTAARVIIQLIGIFSRAAMPLYSVSVATADQKGRRLIQRINAGLTLFLLVPGCIAFAVFGQRLILLWTHGRIVSEESFLALMAVATALHGMWFFRSTLLLAINQHTRFAVFLTLFTLVSLLAGAPAAKAWGLDGIGAAMIGVEFFTLTAMLWHQHDLAARTGSARRE